jgi:hypothetical protein
MTIEQTIEVPASRRMTIEIPREIPSGRTILTFTPAGGAVRGMPPAQELELINHNAERLNREAMDVLSFQSLDI